MTTQTIVAATDFSDQGNAAAAYAVKLAERLDARVQLITAWSMPPTAIAMEMPAPFTGPLYDQLESDTKLAMEVLVDKLKTPKVPIDASVEFGDPRDVVVRAATTLKASMIVVGTHGRRGFRRALIGSIAEGIVRIATCPVLVVR